MGGGGLEGIHFLPQKAGDRQLPGEAALETQIQDFPRGPVVRLQAPTAGGPGSNPGQVPRILHAARCCLRKKKKKGSAHKESA